MDVRREKTETKQHCPFAAFRSHAEHRAIFQCSNPKAESWFWVPTHFKSVNESVNRYRAYLRAVGTRTLQLANLDFDTGKRTAAGESKLTDTAYAGLLHRLAERNFDRLTPGLRQDLLTFFADASASMAIKKGRKKWHRTLSELAQLRAASTSVTQGKCPPPSRPRPCSAG